MQVDTSKGVLPSFAAEEREHIAGVAAEFVAIHVYRELHARIDLVRTAGCNIIGNCSNGGCDIIGNCSSSSKRQLLGLER